jgi:hypothetical protein
MSSEETFSINAAAKLTGYSLPTIRKRLPALKKAGAIQDKQGRWAIPLSALHTVGLMSEVTGDSKQVDSKVHRKSLQGETINETDNLKAQLSEALQRAAVAEAIVQAQAETIAILKPLALERSQPQPRFGLFKPSR